jgi:hypothetical protein
VRRAAVLLALASMLAACGGGGPREPGLVGVRSVFPVQAAFNAERGSPRLLVVLSPT